LAYLIAYGYGSLFAQKASSPLWLPDSVLLAALLLSSPKKWWLYILIALPIRFAPGIRPSLPSWFIWATFINDVIKAGLAAFLLQHLVGDVKRLNTVRKLGVYLGVAVLLVPALSALGGAASRHALGYEFRPAWIQWFLGNALTNLAITPTILLWFSGEYRRLRPHLVELVVWTAGFAICLHYTLVLIRITDTPVALYAPFPFLIWAATRLGPVTASSALSGIALFLMLCVAPADISFSAHSASHSVDFVQLFLAAKCLSILYVAVLIAERQASEERLHESREELNRNYERVRDLSNRLITAQEDERKRIARELHDDISQRLSVVAIEFDKLNRGLDPNLPRSAFAPSKQLKKIIEDTHNLTHQLHSRSLEILGLEAAVKQLCQQLARQHAVEIEFKADDLTIPIPEQLALCFYRVAQEALWNSVKHSHAAQIHVNVTSGDGKLRMKIQDGGQGFDSAISTSGLGLATMRERMRLVEGTLLVESAPGLGTEVTAEANLKATLHRAVSAAD